MAHCTRFLCKVIMEPQKILIVEDDRIISLFTSRLLSEKGFDVVGVIATGEEAVLIAEEKKPDLILMDIILEGEMDGIETVRVIHKKKYVPVIYLTANTDEITYGRAMNTRLSGFMSKPFGKNELVSSVKAVLDGKSLLKQ